MNVSSASSSNAIKPIISTGSLGNKIEAEANKKLEDFHRQQALAIRREAGIRHNNPLTHEEQRKVGQLVMNAAGIRPTMTQIIVNGSNSVDEWNTGMAYYYALRDMVFYGEMREGFYSDHPVLTGKTFNIPLAECASNFKHAADLMSDQLRALFARNNINIPDNLLLRFSIDPFTFLISVSGTDDENLISQLEKVLNYGENSINLAKFIFEQRAKADMTDEQQKMYMLMQRVRHITGFDLRELSIVDGIFRTADGRDITSIFEEALKNSPQAELARAESSFIQRELERLAPTWDSIQFPHLQLGWQSGGVTSSQGHWLGNFDIRV